MHLLRSKQNLQEKKNKKQPFWSKKRYICTLEVKLAVPCQSIHSSKEKRMLQ